MKKSAASDPNINKGILFISVFLRFNKPQNKMNIGDCNNHAACTPCDKCCCFNFYLCTGSTKCHMHIHLLIMS